jgi:hypothetical protein
MSSNASTYEIRKPIAVVLFAGALAILCLDAALIIQNRTLKKELAAPPALLPQVGTRIERLEGVALDGSKIQVVFTGQSNGTLFFVFSTQCAVCNLNWPEWQSIARSAQGRGLRLVYANIESPLAREYAEQYGIDDATLFAQLDPRYEAALNLRLVPETILIGQSGTIESVWPGLLNEQNVQEILNNLNSVNGTKGGKSYVQ